MFLLHFMAAAYHSSYSLAHCSIDFLKSWKSLEKKKVLLSPNNFEKLSGSFQGCWHKENAQFALHI